MELHKVLKQVWYHEISVAKAKELLAVAPCGLVEELRFLSEMFIGASISLTPSGPYNGDMKNQACGKIHRFRDVIREVCGFLSYSPTQTDVLIEVKKWADNFWSFDGVKKTDKKLKELKQILSHYKPRREVVLYDGVFGPGVETEYWINLPEFHNKKGKLVFIPDEE